MLIHASVPPEKQYDRDFLFFSIFLYYHFPEVCELVIENPNLDIVTSIAQLNQSTIMSDREANAYPAYLMPVVRLARTSRVIIVVQAFKRTKFQDRPDPINAPCQPEFLSCVLFLQQF